MGFGSVIVIIFFIVLCCVCVKLCVVACHNHVCDAVGNVRFAV
jgi:hypothetical protein